MSIATKTGDDGTTGLMFGRRVSKIDTRIEACGSVDELNAALGLARACLMEKFPGPALLEIQHELVSLMGEIGVAESDRAKYVEKGFSLISGEAVERLTSMIAEAEKHFVLKGWAMPGSGQVSGLLDFARTVCRRAERRVIEAGFPDTEPQRYLNRLSDLCWVWAREVESAPGRIAASRE